MVSLKIIYLTTSAVVVQQAVRNTVAEETYPSFKEAKDIDCLQPFNAARKSAQLVDLVVASEETDKIPLPVKAKTKETFDAWDQICASLVANGKLPGYRAFALLLPQATSPTCEQAVTKWNLAANNFTALPPKFDPEEALYKNSDNMSLFHLYNPKPNPTLDCKSFSCKATASTETHGLMCLTMPYPLTTNEAPYTEAEWIKIKGAANSSSMAVPSLLAVAAAAAAIAIF